VLSYVREELEPELGRLPFDIICGSSVGAINACFWASSAHLPSIQARLLADRWRELKVDDVLSFRVFDALNLARDFLRARPPKSGSRRTSLVDASRFARIIFEGMSWPQIGRNLRAGLFDALAIGATHVGTGRTTVFIQQRERELPPWTRDPNFVAQAARIGPRHALASAAIPVLFPPVEVDGHLYVDGGLRMNVPFSPAIRLGAQRLLVVSLRFNRGNPELAELSPREEESFATIPFLIGKTLNAVMLDSLDQDLDRLRRFNDILEAGTLAYGPSFGQTLNHAIKPHRNLPVRPVRNLVVRPSQDLGTLAAEVARSPRFAKGRGMGTRLIRELAERESPRQADLASYLLFDEEYAEALIDLGRSDARAKGDDWLGFWSPEPQSAAEWAEMDREWSAHRDRRSPQI
jgi:NTE family protein